MRIFPTTLGDLFVNYVWTAYLTGAKQENIYSEVYNEYKNPRRLPLAARAGLKDSGLMNLAPNHSVDENSDIVALALQKNREAKHEGDLIDIIIKAIGLPFSANVLAGPVLDRITRALFDPIELRGLKEDLEKAELYCSNCAQKIKENEVVTPLLGDNGRRSLMCARCTTPSFARCPLCNEELLFDVYRKRQTSSLNCNYHKKNQKRGEDDVPF